VIDHVGHLAGFAVGAFFAVVSPGGARRVGGEAGEGERGKPAVRPMPAYRLAVWQAAVMPDFSHAQRALGLYMGLIWFSSLTKPPLTCGPSLPGASDWYGVPASASASAGEAPLDPRWGPGPGGRDRERGEEGPWRARDTRQQQAPPPQDHRDGNPRRRR
jgi:hypothetical protein